MDGQKSWQPLIPKPEDRRTITLNPVDPLRLEPGENYSVIENRMNADKYPIGKRHKFLSYVTPMDSNIDANGNFLGRVPANRPPAYAKMTYGIMGENGLIKGDNEYFYGQRALDPNRNTFNTIDYGLPSVLNSEIAKFAGGKRSRKTRRNKKTKRSKRSKKNRTARR